VLFVLALVLLRANRREARHSIEMERRQRLASLGQLAAILAHEIRTPVAAVRGYAQLLLERVEGDGQRLRDPAERIVADTSRLGRLVDDLLAYARPNPPRFASVDLGELARSAAERLGPEARAADVRIITDTPEPARVEADRDRISQALDNMVVNALRFSPAGEAVVIRTEVGRAEVRLEVADRGPGVEPERRQAIFEPFHTTRASGTGLGLAVAQRIADEHQGAIEVLDRRDGGAVFRLTLPLTAARRPSPARDLEASR
jgi:two-component system sensor histidine kinase HydH